MCLGSEGEQMTISNTETVKNTKTDKEMAFWPDQESMKNILKDRGIVEDLIMSEAFTNTHETILEREIRVKWV